MTEDSIIVEARLAWWLVLAGAILFVFSLLFGFLDPHVPTLLDMGSEASGNASDVATTNKRLSQMWTLAPFWGALMLLYGGYRRALNESKRNPGP